MAMKTPLISCVTFVCAATVLSSQTQSPATSSSADPATPTRQTGSANQSSEAVQPPSNRDGLSAPCVPTGNTLGNPSVSGLGSSTSSPLTQGVSPTSPSATARPNLGPQSSESRGGMSTSLNEASTATSLSPSVMGSAGTSNTVSSEASSGSFTGTPTGPSSTAGTSGLSSTSFLPQSMFAPLSNSQTLLTPSTASAASQGGLSTSASSAGLSGSTLTATGAGLSNSSSSATALPPCSPR